jgi:outer membrane receptor protein involved in Fe transport
VPPQLQALSEFASAFSGMSWSAPGVTASAPTHEGYVRALTTLPGAIQLDTTVFGVGGVSDLHIPSYSRVDAHLSWPLSRSLRFSAGAENLFTPQHLEFDSRVSGRDLAEIPRRAKATLTWHF